MKVFKFGGASVNSIERIQNVGQILGSYQQEKLVIVISAMGKTTNALEKVAEAFFAGKKEDALELFEGVKRQHNNFLKVLTVLQFHAAQQQLNDFYTEVEWLLHDKPVRDYDYYYDQIVCVGELLSTTIISFYLNEINLHNKWLDVRDIFRTDDNFRDANVDLNFTQQQVDAILTKELKTKNFVITQGFIGSTDENESTTLGREGSDYSAALFANMLNANNLSIWKDVEGVMNADPKQFADAQYIQHLSFDEVIEMAFYGAQVIHPKTIKPLQNKKIPLHVKCFTDVNLPGTVIDEHPVKNLPPIIVRKEGQVLVKLSSVDYSFVGDEPMRKLYALLGQQKLKPNMMQNGAISVLLVMDDRAEKIQHLAFALSDTFEVEMQKGLTLLTIRHYDAATLAQLTQGQKEVLRQQTNDTVQLLLQATS
jgi:aspartate kinase